MSESGIKRFWNGIFGKKKEPEKETAAKPEAVRKTVEDTPAQKTPVDPPAHSGEKTGDGDESRNAEIQYTKDPERNGMILTKYGIPIDKKLVLPETMDGLPLIELGKGAFGRHEDLEEIVLPDTVETIDQGAFLGCQNLKKVVFPKNLETIQRMAFLGCLKLERIILPGNLKKIGMGAFGYCGMEGCIIPDSVTEIQDGAFARTGLKSINIPAFCVSLGAGVFQECRELTSIIVDERNSVYASPDGVLYDKEKKCLLCYPIAREEKVYSVQNGTEEIAERAFGSCLNLKKIYLPTGCTCIEENAFTECRNLTEITVADGNPSFASLDGVLYDVNQKSLVKYPEAKNIFVLKIPEGIERIRSHAINHTMLHRVELPASIRYLDERSICGNEKLEELWYKGTRSRWYSLEIPENAFCENKWGAIVRFW